MSLTGYAVPAKKKPIAETRDRFDLRIDPSLVARVERQAKRHGLNASSYIRLATSERLERDEATDPTISKNKGT